MLRRIGLIGFVAGLLGLIAYPVWFGTYHNIELGTYRVHDARDGFRTIADVSLSPAAAPLMIDFTGRGRVPEGGDGAAPNLTMVINGPEGTVAAEVITLETRETGGGVASEVMVEATTTITGGMQSGPHMFVFGEGDGAGPALSYLDMSLTAVIASPDPRVRPVSYGLLVLGIALMAIGGRKRRQKGADKDRPRGPIETANIGRRVPLDQTRGEADEAKRQWGRDGGQ